MIRRRLFPLAAFICLLWLSLNLAPAHAWPASPQTHVLGGVAGQDPLRVEVLDNGNMAVYAWDETYAGSASYDYVARYFDRFTWSSVLWVTVQGQRWVLCGDALQDLDFTAGQVVLLPAGEQVLATGQSSITTTWQFTQLPGLVISQTVRYLSGSDRVEKRWTVTLDEGTALDLRLLHGGDVHFHQQARIAEIAGGHLAVHSTDPFNPQQITFLANADSPWENWFAGTWPDACEQAASGLLLNRVEENVTDAGCFVGWHKAQLEAGQIWSMVTYEIFTSALQPADATTGSTGTSASESASAAPVTSPSSTESGTPGSEPPAATPATTETGGVTGVAAEPTGSSDLSATAATAIPGNTSQSLPLQTPEHAGLVRTGETGMLPTLLVLAVFLLAEAIWLRLRLSRRS